MIDGLFSSGSFQVLDRLTQFTGERHRLLTHNLANISTPHFRPHDLSVDSFQRALARAVDQRHQAGGGHLRIEDTRELRFSGGTLRARPTQTGDNILFHDRNNRSLEHQMQALAENAMTHNAALQMLRSEIELLNTAIRERI